MRRAVTLVGETTGIRYVSATSVISVDLLPGHLRAALLTTRERIEVLLRQHRVETFRRKRR
jgi:chorismate-pyruvate lyase